MTLNIYSTIAIYGLAMLPIVISIAPVLQKVLLKIVGNDKVYIYSLPINTWLIFMSDLGHSLFEQVVLWAAVIIFLLVYATALALFNDSATK